MELLPVVALVGGAVCLYGAVKNKNPIGVITAALTGKPLSEVPDLMSAIDSLSGQVQGNVVSGNVGGTNPDMIKNPGSVGSTAKAGTGGGNPNAKTIEQGRTVPVGSGNGAV